MALREKSKAKAVPDVREKYKDVTAKQLALQYKNLETSFNNSFHGKTIGNICLEWPRIVPMLEKVEETAFRVLEKDFIFGVKNHMDQRIWHTGMYQFIETTRKAVKAHPQKKEPLGKFLEVILKRGRDYFEYLLMWIEKKYPITWSLTDGTAAFKPQEDHPEAAGCALMCYFRSLIILGDAYRCSMIYPNKLQRSMEYYEKARRMDPDRGRSFYQMGVVMKDRNDVLSQVYNFTRAHIAPVPIIDARERLMELYDDIYKMHKKVENTYWYKKANKLETKERAGIRKQVWLYSMGSDVSEPAVQEDPHTKDVHFRNMAAAEIFNRFSLTFSNFIGKLFTQIGLDTIDEIAEEALVYFERLFVQNIGIQPLRLVQILTLNMFIINRLAPPQSTKTEVKSEEPVDFKLLTAVQFGMEMFGIMTDRLARLIQCCDWDHKLMEPCCVGVQIWCSWMQMNSKHWIRRRPRPRFCIKRLHNTRWQNKREPEDDVWIAFASLLTALEPAMLKCRETLFSSISTTRNKFHKMCLTPLPESMHLAGLTVFSGSAILEQEYYSAKTHTEARNQNYLRLRSIHRFGSHILFMNDCRILERQLKPDQTYTYASLVKARKTERMEELCGVTEDHYFFWTLNYNYVPPLKEHVEIVRKPDCNNSRVIIRRKKKKNPVIVIPKRPRMPNYEVWLYFSDRGYRTEILVEPYRIVMDTNCLVRNLGYIQLLMGLVVRPIYLPVAVILELRGLAKGGFTKKDTRIYGSIHNPDAKDKLIENEETAVKCRAALDFISQNMRYFYIITSIGVILDVKCPYNYICDSIHDRTKTNDDRILDTCKYLESRDFEARAKDSPRRIYRKTLLVTGDRNLRIKSASMDIPTRPVSSTLYWYFCNRYPEQHAAILEKERDWREKHGYYRNWRGRRGRPRPR